MVINRKSVNCEACGEEYFSDELTHIKLASFPNHMDICSNCLRKTTYEHYKDAAQKLIAVRTLAKEAKGDLDIRLREIAKLIGR